MKKLLLLALVMISFACGGNKLDETPEWKDMGGGIRISNDAQQTTANGIRVFGRAEVPASYLEALDRGFDGLKGELDGLSISERIQNPVAHQVWTTPFPCVPSPEGRVLSWPIRADVYDGSEFDYAYKVKYDTPKEVVRTNWDGSTWIQLLYSEEDGIGGIYAAEQVLNVGTLISQPPIPQTYLCHNDDNPALKFRYGLEHIFLANSLDDAVLNYFTDTMLHWRFGHPLIPMQTGLSDKLTDKSISKFVKEAPDGHLLKGDTLITKEKGVVSITVITK